MRKPETLLKLLKASVDRFSEKSLALHFGYTQEEIEAVYDYAISNDLAQKYTIVECPACGHIEDTLKDVTEKTKVTRFDCSECRTEFTFAEADTYTYLQFKELKKKGLITPNSHRTAKNIVYDNIPDNLKSIKGQPAQRFTQPDTEGLIWHISDLHFGRGSIGNPGHNENLKDAFVQMVKQRPKNTDLLLITGDCTTNGKKSDVKLFQDFIDEVRPYFRDISVVPGNHDAWNTYNFITVIIWNLLRTIFNLLTFSYFVSKRKLPIDSLKLFNFAKASYEFKTIRWADKNIKLMLVDTTFRDRIAIAQGRFPDRAELAQAYLELEKGNYDLCILLLHHHIIRYTEPINSDIAFVKHDLSMRLLNADEAKNFIKAANVKLVLHGHKHTRAKEVMLNNQGHTLLCAAPAAFLNSFKNESHGFIGFNVLRFRNRKVFLANMLYRNGYVCDDITQLELD